MTIFMLLSKLSLEDKCTKFFEVAEEYARDQQVEYCLIFATLKHFDYPSDLETEKKRIFVLEGPFYDVIAEEIDKPIASISKITASFQNTLSGHKRRGPILSTPSIIRRFRAYALVHESMDIREVVKWFETYSNAKFADFAPEFEGCHGSTLMNLDKDDMLAELVPKGFNKWLIRDLYNSLHPKTDQ
eukprot:TRINITY_DN1783_c0_g1_i8.p1 TRINITY_DN1783_c0_g1~~TRINITY_DN1783_c0_g1_i8.p1  ORF type:complete len:187 (-),score=29.10 TRINITY_DN1783_c0_g1_i8:148-708(-)